MRKLRQRHLLATIAAGGLCSAGGCGAPSKAADSDSIRFEVASRPLDAKARRTLARLAHEEGRPGEALRELLWVEEREKLSSSERALLASLLATRGRERLRLGDPDALIDLGRALDLGASVEAASMRDAFALCVVASLRHSSEFRQRDASACQKKLPADHVLRRVDELAGLSLSELERLWAHFSEGGARRRALAVAQAYVDAGGRKTEHLLRWRRLHRWWYGNTRPLLPLDAARRAGDEPHAISRFSAMFERLPVAAFLPAESLAAEWNVPSFDPVLGDIIVGYRRDPALADRLARRFADRSAYGVRESAILCELFYRLEDVERAVQWSLRVAQTAPRMPAAQEAAGLAHAVASMPEKAGIYLVAAAAASGDAGATWGRAAHVFRRAGDALAAIDAGRRAVGLSARGWDLHHLFEVGQAQIQLGRSLQAAATYDALWSRFPVADRARARALVAARSKEEGPGRLSTVLGPIRQDLGFPSSTAR